MEQLGRRSWDGTMMEPRVAAAPVQGAVCAEAATTQNLPQQVTRAALREIIRNLY